MPHPPVYSVTDCIPKCKALHFFPHWSDQSFSLKIIQNFVLAIHQMNY
jgi:hypothetical protein